jgi:hypothetical protein
MNVFTITLMILDFCAAVFYLFQKDFVGVVYWLCVGLLTLSVGYMK